MEQRACVGMGILGKAAGLRHFAILPEPLVGVKLIRGLTKHKSIKMIVVRSSPGRLQDLVATLSMQLILPLLRHAYICTRNVLMAP